MGLAERAAERLVFAAELVDRRVLANVEAGIDERSRDFLGLAEHIGVDHGHSTGLDRRVENAGQLIDGLSARRHSILREAEGGFDDEIVGAGRIGGFGGSGGSESEVAGVQQSVPWGFDKQHGRPQDMTGGKGGQLVVVPCERLTKRQFVDEPFATHAAAVEAGGGGCAERQFVGREVVEVGVGNEAPGLALAGVDSEIELKDPQPIVEEKQRKSPSLLSERDQPDRMQVAQAESGDGADQRDRVDSGDEAESSDEVESRGLAGLWMGAYELLRGRIGIDRVD